MKTFKLVDEKKTYWGLFGAKQEVASSKKIQVLWICDLCAAPRSWEKTVHWSDRIETVTFEHPPEDILSVSWGHKNNQLDACLTHTESEIDKKINQLKKAEQKTNGGKKR